MRLHKNTREGAWTLWDFQQNLEIWQVCFEIVILNCHLAWFVLKQSFCHTSGDCHQVYSRVVWGKFVLEDIPMCLATLSHCISIVLQFCIKNSIRFPCPAWSSLWETTDLLSHRCRHYTQTHSSHYCKEWLLSGSAFCHSVASVVVFFSFAWLFLIGW